MLEMALQAVLVLLLLVAIGWSALLHRRLATFRQGGDGIARFVGDLVTASARAEAVTREMRGLAQDLARQWQRQRGEGDLAAVELRRLTAEAEAAVRDLRLASAQNPGRAVAPLDGDAPGIRDPAGQNDHGAQAPAPAGPDPSPHERIRHAIRDLR